MTAALVLDMASLGSLDDLEGLPVDRVVVPFQTSPARREDIARRWPEARIVHVPPASDGPWQERVTAELAPLASASVSVRGVPILDCFRAPWRDEVALRRALEFALDGIRAVTVTADGAAADMLRAVAARDGLREVRVATLMAPRPRRPGLLARVRRAGPRGLSLALAARFDPSGLRRARLRWATAPAPARAILVSSYVNPTRAAFEALSVLGTRPALHLRSGPGALGGIPVPAGVQSVPLAAAIALDRRRARQAVAQACDAVRDRLRGLSTRDPHDPWGEDDATRFRRALVPTLVPEVAAAIVGLDAVVDATHAETVIVGDEFSFVDRAALHLGKVRGIPTASRQHGVLDSHYLRDTILADVHLAWDEATVAWLEVHGAIPPGQTVRVAGRGAAEPRPPAGRGNDVVLFLQPLELVGVPMADWLSETLPPLLRAVRSSGGRLRAKLHPLQSRSALAALLPADFAGQVDLVTDVSAREILGTARAAVTLDSSVAVDCHDFGVPCFSTAWYEGAYAQDLARLGWVVPCGTPERLEASVRDVFRRGSVP